MRQRPAQGAILLLLLGPGCGPSSVPSRAGEEHSAAARGTAAIRTTSPAIAVGNLNAEIATLERIQAAGGLAPGRAQTLVSLLLLRAQFLGRIADLERAAMLLAELACAPADPATQLLRAATLSALHRFDEAHAELDAVERSEGPSSRVDAARAGLLQAQGRFREAVAVRTQLAAANGDLRSRASLAAALGEAGDLDGAARAFALAPERYRDVSPFPVAWCEFQEGLLWMRAGKLARARVRLQAAYDRLPLYAAAAGHLGEVEAELGNRTRAIELLRRAAAASDDPDALGHLAHLLLEEGRTEEGLAARAQAAARYEDLLARHPAAFWDHGAEFWLGAGEPRRALGYARLNLELRRTPRAYELLLEAATAAGEVELACGAAREAAALGVRLSLSLSSAVERAAAGCRSAPAAG